MGPPIGKRISHGAYRALAGTALGAALIAAVSGFYLGQPSWLPLRSSDAEVVELTPQAIALDREVGGEISAAIGTAARVEYAIKGSDLAKNASGVDASSYCLVVAAAGGLPLYNHNQNKPFRIASVTKLFTTTAAVSTLGEAFQFETKAVVPVAQPDGEKKSEVEALFLVGSGDPYLVTSEFEEFWRRQTKGGPVTRLDELADQISRSGIRKITALYGDASLFDAESFPPTAPTALIQQRLLPPVSALSVDRNLAEWKGGIETARFEADPVMAAAEKLAGALRRRGVAVGRIGSRNLEQHNQGGVEFVVRSAPLGELVGFVNSHSDNFAAEMLAKRVAASGGSQGSWRSFWPRAANILRDHGIEITETQLDDGSGLSGNRSSCSDVVSLMASLGRIPGGSAIARGLASPGSAGTLEDRYTDLAGKARLKAKTGSLRDVSALAGLVDTANSSDVVFSVLINGSPIEDLRVRLEEPVVRALIESTN